MTQRSWSKDRQRELRRMAGAQSRDDYQATRTMERSAVSRRQSRQSVAMTIRCYSCGHAGNLVVNLERVRRPIRLKCSKCGQSQRF